MIRMFDRVGKGIRTSPRDALIASNVDESIRGKSYGFHRAMDNAGAVIGPILAITALLLLFIVGLEKPLHALRWTFILSIIPGFLAVLTIIFFVKESKKVSKSSKEFPSAGPRLKRSRPARFVRGPGTPILHEIADEMGAVPAGPI